MAITRFRVSVPKPSRRRWALTLPLALLSPGILVLAGPTSPAAAVLPPQCLTQANGIDIVCTFTGPAGSVWDFAVPDGATSMRVRAVGEVGRPSTTGALGGRAHFVELTTSSAPGQLIRVTLPNDGGFAGGSGAGAGGGSAAVLRGGSLLVQAAGGGGAGGTASGNAGGAGGDAHTPGWDGRDGQAQGGNPGTAGGHGVGGAGACAPFIGCNSPGTTGTGTRGGAGGSADAGGGGGGGGWRTGGGGGAGWSGLGLSGAGGGGGFSFTSNPGTAFGYAPSGEPRRVVVTFNRARLAPLADIHFGSVVVGLNSIHNATMRNTGTAPLTVTGAAVVGSAFQKMTDGCTGQTLAPNATCTIGVRFTPPGQGTFTGSLVVESNTMDGSDNVALLTGTGVQPVATVSPSSLDFGPVLPNTQSPPQTVTMKNTGTANLVVQSVSVVGPNPAEFNVVGTTCNPFSSLPPNGQCTVQVAFKPAGPGERDASLRFVDNAPGSPHEVPLSGLGAVPTAELTPTQADFGDVEIGSASGPSPVTITNTGQVPLHVSAIELGGPNPSDFEVDPGTCVGVIAVNASCAVQVSFEPQRRGARTGVLEVISNASGSPHEAVLQGVGTSIADLQIRGPGSVYTSGDGNLVTLAVAAGGTATYRIKVVNTGDVTRRFEIGLTQDLAASLPKVMSGTVELAKNAEGNYVTKSLAPGGSVIYLVKVKVNAPGQVTSGVNVRLLADNGAFYDFARTETNVKAPAAGTDAFGLFARAGSQPYIGGAVNAQTTTANTVALGGSTKYQVKLRNDGAAPTAMTYRMNAAANACWTMKATVKVGLATVDITDAATHNGYQTKQLAVGGSLIVTVTLTRVSAGCGAIRWQAASYDGVNLKHYSYLLANPKV